MKMRAVLWDLDGTLVDSGELHWLSWRDTLQAEAVPVTHRMFLDTFGQKNDRILRLWLGEDATEARIQRIADAKEVEYRRLVQAHGLEPLPGAREWMERLHEAGWKQAIASSAPRLNVEVMVKVLNLGRDLDAIVAAEDVTAGKPDPQVFLKAAERLGVPASACIVVEDAAAGVEAARRAGMRCIGVSATGSLDADLFVNSLEDLAPNAFELLQRV
jgi:beta-phosphoglucomutase